MPIKDNRTRPQQITFNCIGVIQLLSEKQKLELVNSNEGYFRTNFLPLIPADLVAKLYSEKESVRPASYAIAHVAGLFLSRLTGLTEEEFLLQIPWNLKYQFAVGIDQWTDDVVYGSETFKDLRARIKKYNNEHPGIDIWDQITHSINMQMADKMGLLTTPYNETYQFGLRMDSLMVDMQATHRPRLDLVYITIANAVKCLRKHKMDVPKELQHFNNKSDRRNSIYIHGTLKEYQDEGLDTEEHPGNGMKDTERRDAITTHRLDKLIPEAIILQEYMAEKELTSTYEYGILCRMISDQSETDSEGRVIIKPKEKILPSSLQSPYEPDAAYRYKREQNYGYVGLVVELFNKEGEGIIVYHALEPNNYTDQQFMKDFQNNHDPALNIEEGKRSFLTVDAAFVSVELNRVSNSLNYDVYCGGVHGVEPDTIFADFVLSQDKKGIESCPAGHKPDKVTPYGTSFRVRFFDKRCANCGNKARCNPTITGKTDSSGSSYVDVSEAKITAALCVKMRKGELDEASLEYINKRNAIEGINAVFRERYNIDSRTMPGLFYARFHFYTTSTCYSWGKYLSYLRRHAVKRDYEIYLHESLWN